MPKSKIAANETTGAEPMKRVTKLGQVNKTKVNTPRRIALFFSLLFFYF